MQRVLLAVGAAVFSVVAATAAVPAALAGSIFQACRLVHADTPWLSTAIEVGAGDWVCVEARGLWTHGAEAGDITPFYGPEGYEDKPDGDPQPMLAWQDARLGTLLGRIGDGTTAVALPIRQRRCFIAAISGDLSLSINDVADGFDDNEGVMVARVSVRRGDRATAQLVAANVARDGSWVPRDEGACFR